MSQKSKRSKKVRKISAIYEAVLVLHYKKENY